MFSKFPAMNKRAVRCSTRFRFSLGGMLGSLLAVMGSAAWASALGPAAAVIPNTPAKMFSLDSVRLLDTGPFATAVKANREYLLALEPDRLLAPFRREAGLPAK